MTFLLFVLTMALLGWIAIVQSRFYRYLRVHHAGAWKRLGQPTPFWNMSPLVQRRVRQFWKSEHTELADPRIDTFGRQLRRVTIAFGVALISFIGLGAWEWTGSDETKMARQPAAPSTSTSHDPVGLAVLAVLTLLGIPGWVLYGRFC